MGTPGEARRGQDTPGMARAFELGVCAFEMGWQQEARIRQELCQNTAKYEVLEA